MTVPTLEDQRSGVNYTLRASALAGAANGNTQATPVTDVGWIRNADFILNVTGVPVGGSPTLDVYVQTKLPDGIWTDILHFAQVLGVVGKQYAIWGSLDAEGPGKIAATTFTKDAMLPVEDAAIPVDTVRRLVLGNDLAVKWVFAAVGSTGDYTFAVTARGQN